MGAALRHGTNLALVSAVVKRPGVLQVKLDSRFELETEMTVVTCSQLHDSYMAVT